MFFEKLKLIKEEFENKISTSFRATRTDLEILDIYATYMSLQTNKKIKRSEIISIIIKAASKILKNKIIKKIIEEDEKLKREIIIKITKKQKIKIIKSEEIYERLKELKKFEEIYSLMIEKNEDINELLIEEIETTGKYLYKIGISYLDIENVNIKEEKESGYSNGLKEINLSENELKRVIISGSAGSGKTYLTKKLIEQQTEQEKDKQIIYVDNYSDRQNMEEIEKCFKKNKKEIINIEENDKINILNKKEEIIYDFLLSEEEKEDFYEVKENILEIIVKFKKTKYKTLKKMYLYFINIGKNKEILNVDLTKEEIKKIIKFGKIIKKQIFLDNYFSEEDGVEIINILKENKSLYININKFFLEKKSALILREKIAKIIRSELIELFKENDKRNISVYFDGFEDISSEREILEGFGKYNVSVIYIIQECEKLIKNIKDNHLFTKILLKNYSLKEKELFGLNLMKIKTGSGYIVKENKKVPILFYS